MVSSHLGLHGAVWASWTTLTIEMRQVLCPFSTEHSTVSRALQISFLGMETPGIGLSLQLALNQASPHKSSPWVT